jgi:hypothetical protein
MAGANTRVLVLRGCMRRRRGDPRESGHLRTRQTRRTRCKHRRFNIRDSADKKMGRPKGTDGGHSPACSTSPRPGGLVPVSHAGTAEIHVMPSPTPAIPIAKNTSSCHPPSPEHRRDHFCAESATPHRPPDDEPEHQRPSESHATFSRNLGSIAPCNETQRPRSPASPQPPGCCIGGTDASTPGAIHRPSQREVREHRVATSSRNLGSRHRAAIICAKHSSFRDAKVNQNLIPP